jgi:hypothetical protein
MPEDPPTPPRDVPSDLVDTLVACSPSQLRTVAQYVDTLAEHKERKQRREADDESADGADSPEDRPVDVPSKATITIKEINDNRYYYWQWREGDQIKSQYKGPVSSAE